MFYDKSPIGVVYFRKEAISASSHDSKDGCPDAPVTGEHSHQCYLVSLGVTAPFRGLGIGARILRWVEAYCKSVWSTDLTKIVLHVQGCNTQAVQFYLRNGFVKVCEIKEYYTKVEGKDALFLKKQI